MTFAVTVQASVEARKRVLTRTLAAVGSTALSGALDTIGSRFADGAPGRNVVVGGQRLSFAHPGSNGFGRMQDVFEEREPGYGTGRRMGWADMLQSSAFSLAFTEPEAKGPLVGVWGGGDLAAFKGRPGLGRALQMGARFTATESDLSVELTGERREGGDAVPEHGVGLNLRLGF